MSQNLYDFSVSGAVRDVLTDSIGNQDSGNDIFTSMLCSWLAGSPGKSAYAVEMLIWHIYTIYTNEISLILDQIQHESIFYDDSAGQRADPGLTPT